MGAAWGESLLLGWGALRGGGAGVPGYPVFACACQQRGPGHRRLYTVHCAPHTPTTGDTGDNLPAVPAAIQTPRQPEGTWGGCPSSASLV